MQSTEPLNIAGMNSTLLQLRLLQILSDNVHKERQILQQQLINNATDPVIKKRRFRMLSNLSTFEASIIKKIYVFDSKDITEQIFSDLILEISDEMRAVIDRSA
jgi:hypothetical protein